MSVILVRNFSLENIDSSQNLNVDFESTIIDFKEMNVAGIQGVITTPPTNFTGQFLLKVSLICEPSTFFAACPS